MKKYKIEKIKNETCDLYFFNKLKSLVKEPKRMFFLKAKKNCIRGRHAHKKCNQFFLSIRGVIDISLDNGKIEKKIKLNENNLVKIEPLNWVSVRLKKNQILCVICDEDYKSREYIRDYKKFIKIKKNFNHL